jgi:4-amino-4-deoxy-L-arabinose transferase-like glycosyltransferase
MASASVADADAPVDAATAPEHTRERLTRFEWGCLAVVAFAFLIRIPFILTPDVIWDSAWYLLLARQFGETGTFYLPWSEPGAPQYNGYWPPLYPAYLTPFVKLFGPSYHTLVLGAVTASALLTTVVFLTTRDLYGRRPAFAAAALIAATPAFLVTDARGMSESLLATMVTLTVWAFLKSLEKPKWLPVAGVFAFLAYLGKASLGLPLVAVGVAAIMAWRVWTRGLRATARSVPDLAVFGLGVVGLGFLALTRTEKIGGLGLGIMEPLRLGVLVPTFPPVYAFKLFFATVFLLVSTLPFSLRALQAMKGPRSERKGALMLASILPIALGAVFTSTFYHTEGRPLVDFDNIRYLTPALVPFVWLVLPHYDLSASAVPADAKGQEVARRHYAWYGAAVGAMLLVFLLNPMAPVNTLTRLKVFAALSLLPLALAAITLTTQFDVATRRVGKAEEQRLVPTKAASGSGALLGGLVVLALALSWYVSAWFGYAALALAVASATRSPRARAIAFVLLLLAATAPTSRTYVPVAETADLVDDLPPGTIVAMKEPLVYFAAVAPDDVRLRMYVEGQPIPDSDALVVPRDVQDHIPDNWTLVQTWDYELRMFPSVWLEQRIEHALTGTTPIVPQIRAFSLFVRNGTAAADALSS